MTLITKKPLLKGFESLTTFTIPPFSKGVDNKNPIRIYQQNFHIDACPRGSFLILMNIEVTNLENDRKSLYNLLGLFDIQINAELENNKVWIEFEKNELNEEGSDKEKEQNDENEKQINENTEEQKDEQPNKELEEKKDEELDQKPVEPIVFVVEYVQNFT